MAQREIPEEEFLLGRFLPRGGKLMLAGDTGIGKSWLCLNVIRSLVLGEPLFNNAEWPVYPSRVLYIETEVGKFIGERLKAVFSEQLNGELPFYCHQPEGPFDIRDGECAQWIIDQVKEYSIDVVVLDPISELASFDENSNPDVNKLSKAMSRLKAAIIFSHHIAKPPNDTTKGYDALSLNNARGAKAFGDRIDSALMVSKKDQLGKESWSLKAKWAKTRHCKSHPSPGIIKVNDCGSGRAIWYDDYETPHSQGKTVTIPIRFE